MVFQFEIQLTKATIYILTSAVGAASCILPIVAYGMIPLDENGERVEGSSISAGIMFAYAIIVGFCAGVLNCLIMACTGKIHNEILTCFDPKLTHLIPDDSFDPIFSGNLWSKANCPSLELRFDHVGSWFCWWSTNRSMVYYPDCW